MERVKRRWWTLTVTAAAALVIVVAFISGAFQIAVYLLPTYRDDLSAWVTQVAGRPVRIGGINLVWRGFYPRLDLSDITLYDEAGAEEMLSAERLSLGFALYRLAIGDVTPNRVELSGMDLVGHLSHEGRISIAGFDAAASGPRADLDSWLKSFENFRRLRLENCTLSLEVEALGGAPLEFQLNRLDTQRSASGFNAEGQLELPEVYGDSLEFEAAIEGDIARIASWHGDFSARAAGLRPQPWLRGLASGTRLSLDESDTEIQGRIEQGTLAEARLQWQAERLQLTRDSHSAQAAKLETDFKLSREAGAWRLAVEKLLWDGEAQLRGSLWLSPQPPADGENGGAPLRKLRAEAGLLHLPLVTRLAPFLRQPPAWLAGIEALQGEVREATLSWQQVAGAAPQYSLRAVLDQAGLLRPGENAVQGLSAELRADQNGGSLRLKENPITLQLPKAFGVPLLLRRASGELLWTQEAEGLRLSAPVFGYQMVGLEGQGSLKLWLPREGSPVMELDSRFAAQDVLPFKAYMPLHWGEALKAWLTTGIGSGRVREGDLHIKGPLADFPFHERATGEWKLALDTADVRLAYAPHWPVVEDLSAKLLFAGNGLSIEVSEARLQGGAHGDKATAVFKDFREALLTIDAQVSGWMPSLYDFILRSPLKEKLNTLVNKTTATGPALVNLHLDIPLREVAKTAASGTVTLNGVKLNYQGLAEPFEDIRGLIAFDGSGVSADNLNARFMQQALPARILPRAGTQGVISASLQYSPDAQGGGLSQFVPELVRRALSGSTRFDAELPLGVADAALTLKSDMTGMAVALPPPLGKASSDAVPLQVALGADAEAPLRVKVEYDQRLGADVALTPPAASVAPAEAAAGATATATATGWQARAMNLRLGAGAAPPAASGEGVFIRGSLEQMDLPVWVAALESARLEGLALREVDLSAQRWLWGAQSLREMRAVYTPSASGWSARLEGAGAQGQLNFIEGRLTARLQRLELDNLPLADPAEVAARTAEQGTAKGEPANPLDWPALSLSSDKILLSGADYGTLVLNTSKTGLGQSVDSLSLSGGVLEGSAVGDWQRASGQSSAKLKFDLSSRDMASVLRSLGFTPNLSAKTARFNGDLAWAPSATGLEWARAEGKVGLLLNSGTLKAVEPGAGRVLGLINFYTLPRRLTLDFRDVVNQGLAFDQIKGNFNLAKGDALTDDLLIDGPSLRMEMRGRVGLLARDYDQRIAVYPDVSSGFTLGATLLGGPAVGVFALIAQQVLGKPLDQVTQLRYEVTGSWDNPEVRNVTGEARATAVKPDPPPVPSPGKS